MVYSCYVCKQEYYPDCGLSFHGFPRDPTMRAIWVNALPRRTRRVTHTAMVCSRHFKKEDYEMKQWKRVLKRDAVPSVRLTNDYKRNHLGGIPDSAIFFGTLSIPAHRDQNQAAKLQNGAPLRLRKNDEVVIACNSDNDSEIQDAEYLELEESGSSYKPSESSSEDDQSEVPQTENNTLLISVKKDNIKDNVTSDENVNIDNEALTQAVARINEIADELSNKKDDEFDGFVVTSSETKMALKMLNPLQHKFRHHSVRFTSDDMPKYKCLDSSDSSPQIVPNYQQNPSPSPESPTGYQPAAHRFKHNEQRIKLLTQINQIVQQRVDLETNRLNLSNLLEELRRKLKRRTEECHYEKKEKMKALKQANQRLEKEKQGLTSEIEHMKRHLLKEESHHVHHARTAVAQAIQGVTNTKVPVNDNLFSQCSVTELPNLVSRNVARNAPSRSADSKLAAARLMRDIAELRQRVAQVENRLANEMKRKRQAEMDIARLRKELSNNKSYLASLRLAPPPLRKQCSKFA